MNVSLHQTPFSKKKLIPKQAVIVILSIYEALDAVSLCRAAEILICAARCEPLAYAARWLYGNDVHPRLTISVKTCA